MFISRSSNKNKINNNHKKADDTDNFKLKPEIKKNISQIFSPSPEDDISKNKIIEVGSDDESINPLDEEFTEKCYMYGLPFNWNDNYTSNKLLTKIEKKSLSKNYNKMKRFLISKNIELVDILQLKNITNNERLFLIEKFSILQSLDSDLYEYIKYRELLKEEILYYKNRKMKYNDIIYIENKKNELKKMNVNSDELEERIIKLDIEKYHKAIVYQKFIKLKSMSQSDSEFHKLKEWLDCVCNIPFNIINNSITNSITNNSKINNNIINNFLYNVKYKLDQEIYGMKQIKEELLLLLNHRLFNPNASDHSVALVGPPGVGKTKLIRTFASILCLPFEQISIGGVNDASFLDGHSYTYEGARPGKIVESLKNMKCKNGILFFDEIDKIGTSSRAQEVSNQLLHITDFTQNSSFCDKYLPEIPIDLSKLWFIFSLNNENLMDPVLKNRMNLIKVSGYNVIDKIEIINKFIIPQICSSLKLDHNKILLTDEIKKYIIDKCSKEEGIRDLKRSIETLYRKLDILCKSVLDNGTFGNLELSFAIKNFKLPYTVTIQDINLLLKDYMKNDNNLYNLYV